MNSFSEVYNEYYTISKYDLAKKMFDVGQQSKQAEIVELRKRIEVALDYTVNHGGYDDLTHIINILKGDQL